MNADDWQAEARRQQALMLALMLALRGARAVLPAGAQGLPGPRGADALAGLRAYRANAQAIAGRALAAAYPVLTQLLGDEAMAALARDLWRDHPPLRGDLACFGGVLADWLAQIGEFADVPYLPDVARLEWAVHQAAAAADVNGACQGLQHLGDTDPDRLRVDFVPGSVNLASAWPVLTLWQAHQVPKGQAPDLRAARAALADGRGESVWVWRRGLQVELALLGTADQAFNNNLLAGMPLGPALACASAPGCDFSFEHWLTRALREGWLAAIQPLT